MAHQHTINGGRLHNINKPQKITNHWEECGKTVECSNISMFIVDNIINIDDEKPLYSGCTKYTKITALVRLYNLKRKYGDKIFGALLKLLADMLPNDHEIPISIYKAIKTLSSLGLEYVKIDAFPNNCILYWKEYESLLSVILLVYRDGK